MNGSALGTRVLCGCAPLVLGLAGSCASVGPGVVVGPAPQAGRDEPDAFHEEGLYLGGYGEATRIGGDFDDPFLIVGPTDTTTIPEIDNGGGYSVKLGYRWHRRALEVGYGMSSFDGDFLGFDLDADIHTITIDWKEFFRVQTNLQPFLFVGLGIPEMKIDDAAFDTATLAFTDAELDGIAINVGGGLNFYVTPRIALTAQGMFSFARYNEVKNFSGDESIIGDVDADAWTVAFGASYTF